MEESRTRSFPAPQTPQLSTAHLIPWDSLFWHRSDYGKFWKRCVCVLVWVRHVCARHCETIQDVCSPFSPPLLEGLMGNLVWADSDKWPVCGEGIRKKGKREKREDNTKGMLFLEEHSKEEADHVTVMGNITCIFHKNRGNQHYDSPHSMIPPVFGQRGSEGQGWLCICVSWTVTRLLLPLSYDLPSKWQNMPVIMTP